MAYRICRSFEIQNGHMLSKHPDLCKFPHGHTRKVELVLETDDLDANEMVCDFKVLKEAMNDYLATWDHAFCINTDDPMYQKFKEAYGDRVIDFPGQDPTTEVMAKLIHDTLQAKLKEYATNPDARYPLSPEIRIVRVRVWETSSVWAEYSTDD
jgi:6-pyruvoyltetrahydropterin/6-carboxytetrahydropterin synthase